LPLCERRAGGCGLGVVQKGDMGRLDFELKIGKKRRKIMEYPSFERKRETI